MSSLMSSPEQTPQSLLRRRAVLLVTVYRRYHELRKNLKRTMERAEIELGYRPDVVLVWSCPEVGRNWVMRELLDEGLVTHLIKRYEIPGLDGVRPTTFSESINIRKGLEFIRDFYDNGQHYVIMHAADIFVHESTLKFCDDRINGRVEDGSHNAVLFHWENGICHQDIWATYFFAVVLDDLYWPPVSPPDENDVLERQWGRLIDQRKPPLVFKWHNAGQRRYVHKHESEFLPPFPTYAEHQKAMLALYCKGHLPWYVRLIEFARDLFALRVDWENKSC